MKKTCSIVVVTYNRIALLKECIHSLLNQEADVKTHIVIVNNNSSDNTEDYLNKIQSDQIVVCNLKKNLGGAGGFEYGIQKAWVLFKDDYFWIMDDDTIPTPSALSELLRSANNLKNEFAFLCSNVRNLEDKAVNVPIPSQCWTDKVDDDLIQVEIATFVSLFFSQDKLESYGLPIGNMFIWGDDAEFTKRLTQYFPGYLVLKSKVIHKIKGSRDTLDIFYEDENRIYRYFYRNRNMIFTSRKYDSFKHTVVLITSLLLTMLKIPFKSKNHKYLRFKTFFKGIIYGFFYNPTVKCVNK